MISFSKTLRSTAALCVILSAGISVAQEGVVRMSDRSKSSASNGAGVVRIIGSRGPAIQRTSFVMADGSCGDDCAAQGCLPPGPATQQCLPVQNCLSGNAGDSCGNGTCNSGCQQGGCNSGKCTNGGACNGSCYTQQDCNSYVSSCDASGMPRSGCHPCQCNPCQCGARGSFCNGSFGDSHRDHVNTLFARPVDSGTGSVSRDCWRGQSMSFRNKNARLANLLFGWLVPSGCCGQGCPPVGAYHVTYADQPDYIDQRDTQLYAAQGYGMPMTVPLAPNVNHAYNYSAGIPASRVTHIGNYNPQTSPRPLYHQTW